MTEKLWDVLDYWLTLHDFWQREKTEEALNAQRAAWHLAPTCPGRPTGGQAQGVEHCTATVLTRDTRKGWPNDGDEGELYYRGACLYCGWLSWRDHDDENLAAEDAVDHTHPGWRAMPVVPPMPHPESPRAAEKAMKAWRGKVDQLLPAGWLESGGPICTARGRYATRHVPFRTPWGGYDMAVREAIEQPGGQLALPLDVDEVVKVRRGGRNRPVQTVPTGDRL